jgi:hypothetical protein
MSEELQPFPELDRDTAFEVLIRLINGIKSDRKLVCVLSACKAFRAVNQTFRHAFDYEKFGCRLIKKYTVWLHNHQVQRVVGISRFLSRTGIRDTRCGSKIKWVGKVQCSIRNDIQNYLVFINALKENIKTSDAPLPVGQWQVSRTECGLAPYGTVCWAESILYAVAVQARDQSAAQWSTRAVKGLLDITVDDEEPSVSEHLRRLKRENARFANDIREFLESKEPLQCSVLFD